MGLAEGHRGRSDPHLNYRLPNPTGSDWRQNYDRTFGKEPEPCAKDGHKYPVRSAGIMRAELTLVCSVCGHSPIEDKRR